MHEKKHLNTNQFSFDEWYVKLSRPIIIAGPCSAESPEQLLSTAKALNATRKVDIFRTGIWKPRTRPDGFEGFGETALQWLRDVKNETGMMVTIEVAKPQHVELALQYGIDSFWIGARTVANPFSVQELAESLRGINVPVLIKNPIAPDLRLWLGAFERLHQVGVSKLLALHRGFQYFKQNPYRNFPMWEIPIELRKLMPEIPFITDISHICGQRNLLQETAQKAIDMESDGLMIESHYDPENALTDAQQQITPKELKQLLKSIHFRKKSASINFNKQLEILRDEIDKTDHEIIRLLAKRFDIIDQIGAIKKQNNVTILQIDRWKHVFEDRLSTAKEHHLDETLVRTIFETIHGISLQKQNQILNEEKEN